jgi:hypothetical protein
MRCPRCQLADIPEGMGMCVRCGYALPEQRGADAERAAHAPTEPAASARDARRPELVGPPRPPRPAPPVVIMDDGEGDGDEDEEDEDRAWAPRPARRVGAGVAAAVGLTIALGSGAVWLTTGSAPARQAIPDVVGPAPATPPGPTPAPPDTAAPRAAPSAPVVAAPRPPSDSPPVAARGERTVQPALVSINSIPWSSVYIDGRAMGNTPQLDLRVAPGSHRLRVERDGFQPFERVIAVAPGQRLRITNIALVKHE